MDETNSGDLLILEAIEEWNWLFSKTAGKEKVLFDEGIIWQQGEGVMEFLKKFLEGKIVRWRDLTKEKNAASGLYQHLPQDVLAI
jgi:hypothetical protein